MSESIFKLQQFKGRTQKFITIPKNMCDKLNFNKGDFIRLVLEDKHIIISKVKATSE